MSLPILTVVHHLRARAPSLDLVFQRDEGAVRIEMQMSRCMCSYPAPLFALRGSPATLEEIDACVAAATPWMQEQVRMHPHGP